MYQDVKVGDVLMSYTQHGVRRHNENAWMLEWVPNVVTKVTPKFFFVGDKKYSKDGQAFGMFGTGLYHPGSMHFNQVVPAERTDPAEVQAFKGLCQRLREARRHSNQKVQLLHSLERQVYFAEAFCALENELAKELEAQDAKPKD